jgi:hypothetical protein
MSDRPGVRYYSERDQPLFPVPEMGYGVGPDGEPILLPRDDRMWMSVEWAAEHGIPVPENWRDLP